MEHSSITSACSESEKHQEPRNQVPEEESGTEEGLAKKSCIKISKLIIHP